jgi:hypothetical protein
MEELRLDERLRALGVQTSEQGRSAIKGSKERRVWDLLPLAPAGAAFTKAPHLTMGVHEDWVEVMVTFPNAMDSSIRRRLVQLGSDGFVNCVDEILEAMQPLLTKNAGVVPLFRGVQRRYKNPSIVRSVDGSLEFDLRTAFGVVDGPKYQARWLETGFGMFAERNGANYQMQIGAQFSYRDCPILAQASSVKALADAWLACRPLLLVAMPELDVD